MASIRATARKATRAAFAAAGDALISATLKLQPTVGAYDPATDTQPTTWGFNATLKALEFDDVEEKRDSNPEDRMRVFLFKGEDLVAAGAELRGEQEGEIVVDAAKWNVVKTETDPTGSVWMFYCRR